MREVVLAALEDAKGERVCVLDVRALTDITDYMIIATGASDRHAATLAERVLERMKAAGWRHLGLEGLEPSGARDWVLVDFVDVVVHIMRAQTRERYDLESLWDESLSALLAEPDAARQQAAES
ncbi:MAG: ribosome silencing factor [bacterium]